MSNVAFNKVLIKRPLKLNLPTILMMCELLVHSFIKENDELMMCESIFPRSNMSNVAFNKVLIKRPLKLNLLAISMMCELLVHSFIKENDELMVCKSISPKKQHE